MVDFENGGLAAVEEAVADVENVVLAINGDEGNEALGFIKFLGEKGVFALEFVTFFFVGGEEAYGADEAGELADVGDGLLGVDKEVAGEAWVRFGEGDTFAPFTLEDLNLKNGTVIDIPEGCAPEHVVRKTNKGKRGRLWKKLVVKEDN